MRTFVVLVGMIAISGVAAAGKTKASTAERDRTLFDSLVQLEREGRTVSLTHGGAKASANIPAPLAAFVRDLNESGLQSITQKIGRLTYRIVPRRAPEGEKGQWNTMGLSIRRVKGDAAKPRKGEATSISAMRKMMQTRRRGRMKNHNRAVYKWKR